MSSVKAKTVLFELSMPGCGSWNGKWSGAGKRYVVAKSLPEAKARELDGQYYSYRWSDGWAAGIRCKISESASETARARRESAGFSGYDWMIDSIIRDGEILADHDRAAKTEAACTP